MRRYRFFVPIEFGKKIQKIVDQSVVHKMNHVLRLSPDDTIEVCDNDSCYPAIIQKMAEREIVIELQERAPFVQKKCSVDLYCAILKNKNFELVVEKTSEIGIRTITPIICKRSVKTGVRLERLQVIAEEATRQSGQVHIPLIKSPQTLAMALLSAEIPMYICDPSSVRSNAEILKHKNASIFIGPEGGWAHDEIQTAKKAGAITYSLGETTLRAETAAIVATFEVSRTLDCE